VGTAEIENILKCDVLCVVLQLIANSVFTIFVVHVFTCLLTCECPQEGKSSEHHVQMHSEKQSLNFKCVLVLLCVLPKWQCNSSPSVQFPLNTSYLRSICTSRLKSCLTSYRVATNLEYSGNFLKLENSWNSQGILCNLKEKLQHKIILVGLNICIKHLLTR